MTEQKKIKVYAKRPKEYRTSTDRLSKAALTGEAQRRSCEEVFPEYQTGMLNKKEKAFAVMDVWDSEANPTYKPVDGKKVEIRGNFLTYFDEAVYYAAVSLITTGNQYFTLNQILAVVYGLSDSDPTNANYSQEMIDKVDDAIRHLSVTRVIISLKSDLPNKKMDLVEEGTLLDLTKKEITVNGVTKTGYAYFGDLKRGEYPILYRYSQSHSQVASVPVRYLHTPCKKNYLTVSMQEYLRSRISMMSAKHTHASNKILLSSLFEAISFIETDEPDPTFRKKKQRLLEQLEKILTYWKEQSFISNFEWEYDPERKDSKRAIFITVE